MGALALWAAGCSGDSTSTGTGTGTGAQPGTGGGGQCVAGIPGCPCLGDGTCLSGTCTAGTCVAPGGSGGTTSLGGPELISVSPNSPTITETGDLVISVVATDPDGASDLLGGVVQDATTGATYGSLVVAGAPGSYSITLSWAALNTASAITMPAGGAVRTFRVVVYDQAGNQAFADVPIQLACADATYGACSGTCVNLTRDPYNCGACDRVCDISDDCAAGLCITTVGDYYPTSTVSPACNGVCGQYGLSCINHPDDGYTGYVFCDGGDRTGPLVNCTNGSSCTTSLVSYECYCVAP